MLDLKTIESIREELQYKLESDCDRHFSKYIFKADHPGQTPEEKWAAGDGKDLVDLIRKLDGEIDDLTPSFGDAEAEGEFEPGYHLVSFRNYEEITAKVWLDDKTPESVLDAILNCDPVHDYRDNFPLITPLLMGIEELDRS